MPIDFWISVGSTYSYLSLARIEAVERELGVEFVLRPFNVREIMVEQQNIPFANKPVKAAYMWRDIERRALSRGLHPRLPAPYPLADLPRANRVALIACRDGWGRAYLAATYALWFEQGLPAGEDPNLSRSIAAAGREAGPVLEEADSPDGEAALARATDEAKGLGIFGAPTFAVGDEIFWGDDRMDDAVDWFRRTHAL
ncbi:MAG: 2-hydroxychromene-2-carboxylate isomerase [Tranquillimonas sp.]|jgi:2-hydroxychromene-2-carboxylate isomerase